MATEETSNPPAPATEGSILDYGEMIMAAIEASDDKNGLSKSAIAKYIESNYQNLPPTHGTLLTHHLNRMKLSGELIMVKNNYMKPDPNAPPKRGRGRPPKPKEPLPPGAVLSPPRPRGRPPKAKDPNAPPSAPKRKAPPSSSSGTPKKRGRPPKNPGATPSTAAATAPTTQSGVKRGRGRPPKVKPAVAPVGA